MIASGLTHRLQQAADYRTVRKTLRASAIGSLVIGGITLLLAAVPPIDPVAALLGLVLVGTGSWNLARPRPTGILVDGATIGLVGIFNIASTIPALQAGEGSAGSTFWVKVGVFQLLWAGQAVWRYTRFRRAFDEIPADSELHQLDELVSALWKSKPKESADVIEFKLSGFHETAWKGRLTDGFTLLACHGGREVKVAGRDEIEIADRGKVLLGSARRATFTIRGRSTKGTIPASSLERFQQWKTGVVLPMPIAA